ncbi:MAG: hypothetical protein Q4E62_09155, partial [Sutterellaceae bacterium]|nr:hypothetical protein [Sutterellaceae bacterium]
MTSTPKAAGPILRTSVIAAAVALAMSPCINAAYDITFDGIDGSPYATVRVFESQDRDDLSEDYLELIEFNEIRSLTQTDRTSLETAFQYVSDLLGPSKNTPLLYLLLSSEATNNASAGSESENTDGLGSQFFASVTGLKNFGDEAVGVVTIDKGSVDAGFSVSPLSVLPQSGPHMYLPSALIHELIHAYGMLAGVGYDEEQDQYGFGEELTPYEAGLRDVFGNRATGSKEFNIIRSESEVFTEEFIKSQEKPDQFNILFRDSKGGVSFAGDRVNELIGKDVRIYDADTLIVDADGRLVKGDMTNSVVGGIPINGLEIAGNKIDFDFEMSHLELQNSFLSHQNWRNWSTPMEAEMAF